MLVEYSRNNTKIKSSINNSFGIKFTPLSPLETTVICPKKIHKRSDFFGEVEDNSACIEDIFHTNRRPKSKHFVFLRIPFIRSWLQPRGWPVRAQLLDYSKIANNLFLLDAGRRWIYQFYLRVRFHVYGYSGV